MAVEKLNRLQRVAKYAIFEIMCFGKIVVVQYDERPFFDDVFLVFVDEFIVKKFGFFAVGEFRIAFWARDAEIRFDLIGSNSDKFAAVRRETLEAFK